MTAWTDALPALNLLRVFALAYTGLFVWQQLRWFSDQKRYMSSSPPSQPRMQLLGVQGPKISASTAVRCMGGLIAALSAAIAANLAGLDLASRALYVVAIVLHAASYWHVARLGYVIRKVLLAPVVFIVLVAAPGLVADFGERTALWPFALLQGYVALIYVSTGLEKLARTGPSWGRGDVLRWHLVEHHLWGDMPVGFRVAHLPRLCAVMSTGTLVWEVSFFVALLHPVLAVAYVVYGVGFHAGTSVLMRIHYHRFWLMNYLVFLPQAVAVGMAVG